MKPQIQDMSFKISDYIREISVIVIDVALFVLEHLMISSIITKEGIVFSLYCFFTL